MIFQSAAIRKAIFIVLFVIAISPYSSPPAALALGIAAVFAIGNPFPGISGRPAKYLLQGSVVLLGFGMDLTAIFRAGRDGIVLTIATIIATIVLGTALGRLLRVDAKLAVLISSGTAICGGSAIAAVGPAIRAEPKQIAVSLGIVFILNSIALFFFPFTGHLLGMTQQQFGIWAAIAIHDTSSVVGAAQAFGAEAAGIAATVKLARALWIAPVALIFGRVFRNEDGPKTRVAVPWFVFLFLFAAAVRSYAPAEILPSIFDSLTNAAKAGLSGTLFIIGSSLHPHTLRDVGARPFFLGAVLWILVIAASIAAVFGTL
jgi:uncharacterized integral membrane protein (TIGR00698 family)